MIYWQHCPTHTQYGCHSDLLFFRFNVCVRIVEDVIVRQIGLIDCIRVCVARRPLPLGVHVIGSRLALVIPGNKRIDSVPIYGLRKNNDNDCKSPDTRMGRYGYSYSLRKSIESFRIAIERSIEKRRMMWIFHFCGGAPLIIFRTGRTSIGVFLNVGTTEYIHCYDRTTTTTTRRARDRLKSYFCSDTALVMR